MAEQRAQLQDGAEYVGRPVAPEWGKNGQKLEIRLYMEITEGPLAGTRVKYTSNLRDTKSIWYTKRDLKAAGWTGADITTFIPEVNKMSESGEKVTFSVRLAKNVKEDGTTSEWWTVGSIGAGAAPLVPPTDDDRRHLNAILAEEPSEGAAPALAARPAAAGAKPAQASKPAAKPAQNSHPNAPGNGDDVPW